MLALLFYVNIKITLAVKSLNPCLAKSAANNVLTGEAADLGTDLVALCQINYVG
jgi:hypothetical protein